MATHTLCLLQVILLCKTLSNKQSGSVIYDRISAAQAFNWIVFKVNFGLTSYEELPIGFYLLQYKYLHYFTYQLIL